MEAIFTYYKGARIHARIERVNRIGGGNEPGYAAWIPYDPSARPDDQHIAARDKLIANMKAKGMFPLTNMSRRGFWCAGDARDDGRQVWVWVPAYLARREMQRIDEEEKRDGV